MRVVCYAVGMMGHRARALLGGFLLLFSLIVSVMPYAEAQTSKTYDLDYQAFITTWVDSNALCHGEDHAHSHSNCPFCRETETPNLPSVTGGVAKTVEAKIQPWTMTVRAVIEDAVRRRHTARGPPDWSQTST